MPKIYSINAFGGINESKKISSGELSSAMNIISDDYPCASVRKGYKDTSLISFDAHKYQMSIVSGNPEHGFTGVFFDSENNDATDNKYYTGGHFFYKGKEVATDPAVEWNVLDGDSKYFPKSFVDFGEKLYLYPDNAVYNYADPKKDDENKSLLESCSSEVTCQALLLEETRKGEFLRSYIYARDRKFTFPFQKGDSIIIDCSKLEDCIGTGSGRGGKWTCIVDEVRGYELYVHIYDEKGAEMHFENVDTIWLTVAIKLKSPRIHYATSFNNRIYGLDNTGEYLYISWLGDAIRFYSDGTASGGCVVPVADKKKWTGIATVNSQVVCFKENTMHIVAGNMPSNFQISNVIDIGCIDGKSIAVHANRMYWLAYDGFYMYDGSYPVLISRKLKGEFTQCNGVCIGERYYASCFDGEKHRLLVYDTAYNLWHEIDNPGYIQLSEHNHKLIAYRLDKNENGGESLIADVQLDNVAPDTEWYFETGDINFGFIGEKTISDVWLRAEMQEGSTVTVEVVAATGARDYTVTASPTQAGKLTAFRLPIMINPDDSFRINVSGKGQVTIYDIEFAAKDGGRNI